MTLIRIILFNTQSREKSKFSHINKLDIPKDIGSYQKNGSNYKKGPEI